MNHSLPYIFLLLVLAGCVRLEDAVETPRNEPKKMRFNVSVYRDGEQLTPERYGLMTKGTDVSVFDQFATMDPNREFGLIGFDSESGELLLDNHPVSHDGYNYSSWVGGNLWGGSTMVTLSAYYPYQSNVVYQDNNEAYSIPFSTEETEAGPLISKTMQHAIDELNHVSIEFHHITNDIGYKICDVTPDEQLQGLIHLRKLTAYNVASSGIFVNDLMVQQGSWHRIGYYRNVVIFDGDAVVGVGSENERFVGYSTLEKRLSDSHRFYSIPDEILLGKQYVEVEYDIDSFTIDGFTYPAIEGMVTKYALYGLLPDNVFENGKQYTFHIGLDLSPVYQQVTFSASVSDWETKIYENNEDF